MIYIFFDLIETDIHSLDLCLGQIHKSRNDFLKLSYLHKKHTANRVEFQKKFDYRKCTNDF